MRERKMCPLWAVWLVALVGCDGRDAIAPEPRGQAQEDLTLDVGGRFVARIDTAATDRSRLRSFNVTVLAGAPMDVYELVQGPFVVTGKIGDPWAFINFDGACPAAPLDWGTELFLQDNLLLFGISGDIVVPAGATLCALLPGANSTFSYNISGFVPYE